MAENNNKQLPVYHLSVDQGKFSLSSSQGIVRTECIRTLEQVT